MLRIFLILHLLIGIIIVISVRNLRYILSAFYYHYYNSLRMSEFTESGGEERAIKPYKTLPLAIENVELSATVVICIYVRNIIFVCPLIIYTKIAFHCSFRA